MGWTNLVAAPVLIFVILSSLEGLESPIRTVTLHGKATIIILLQHASLEELLDQGRSCFVIGPLLLHHGDLGLQRLVVGELGLGLLLLEDSLLLLLLDLLLGATPLAASLEHVGGAALVCCRKS